MSQFLYQIYIYLLGPILSLASLFNKKAKLGKEGRAASISVLKAFKNKNPSPPIWFHVSSLGELEQAYPLIEFLKKDKADIIVSFFSPSGYTKFKNYPAIDCAIYLPIDTPKNAKEIVALIDPKICIWVKYDFWFNHLKVINKSRIPLYLISAKFDQQHFLIKGLFRGLQVHLKLFDHIFLQDQSSLKTLKTIGLESLSVVGDTRIDRVLSRATKSEAVDLFKDFKSNEKLICLGSIHPICFPVITQFINENPQYKFIVAPHEIDPKTVEQFAGRLKNYLLYTQIKEQGNLKDYHCLILDTIGDLFSSYAVADAIYVGGGFGYGIHNILEPALFLKPILIGPRYSKFKEATELTRLELVQVVKDKGLLAQHLSQLIQMETRPLEEGLKAYFARVQGATKSIYLFLNQKQHTLNES